MRLKTKPLAGITVPAAALLMSPTAAGAFGTSNYTAPWGCSAQFQSWDGSPDTAQTNRQSADSCAPMFARIVFVGGSVGSWASGTWSATATTNSSASGGQHKVCDGCTIFAT